MTADPAHVSTSGRAAILERQTEVLDRRSAQQYEYSARLRPETHRLVPQIDPSAGQSEWRKLYQPQAEALARKYRIPQAMFVRLVTRESNWNPSVVSHKGAIGLAQLMPGTARILGVDPHDPHANLDAGARYLRRQYDRFGSWRLALAAYNAGPGAVQDHRGVPPYRETQAYVRAILDQPG